VAVFARESPQPGHRAAIFARMPKPRVYVETTIPNFYYDFRESPAIASRREATRLWWVDAAENYELVTSTFVQGELAAGTSHWAKRRLELLDTVPLLVPTPAVDHIVKVYIEHKLMPAKPPEDAMHLALASYHDCDFIVTWNCRHLANPNKARHIRAINTRLGLVVPTLATPLELLKGASDERGMDGG
jgi:predicted nucleic acid-binding protein